MKRIISLMLITTIFFVVVLSTIFIAEEFGHRHECDADDCPICIFIEQCENTLRQLKECIVSGFQLSIPLIIISEKLLNCDIYIISETLVSKKIRLNN